MREFNVIAYYKAELKRVNLIKFPKSKPIF